MDNNSQKNELQVEQYDAATAEMKKNKIQNRVGLGVVGVGISTAIIAAALAYFGWAQFGSTPNAPLDLPPPPGGAGAWFEPVWEDIDE